jgi:predicted transcriptional regulator
MLPDEEAREYGTGTYAHRWSVDWRRISWGAIFAGAFVTLAIFITLQILGAGIGASTIDLTGGETSSPRAYGIGAAVWWLITGLISLFIGGWVAGRLGWLPQKLDRILHGLTTWALFYVVMFYLVTTTLSALVGGGLSTLGRAAGGAAQTAGEVAASPEAQQTARQQGLSLETIRQEIAKAIGAETGQQAQQTDLGQLASAVSDYLGGSKTPQERQEAVQEIAQATGKSQAEADQMLANLEQKAQQAAETTEEVATATGVSFILIAVAMLLGAVASMLGSLLAPAPRGVYPYERGRGPEVKVERETYASR